MRALFSPDCHLPVHITHLSYPSWWISKTWKHRERVVDGPRYSESLKRGWYSPNDEPNGDEKMANPRQDNRPQHAIEEQSKRTVELASEQTKRMEETSVKAGEQMAQASANFLQQSAEIVQTSWNFGADMTTGVFNSSSEQLRRAIGLSGHEIEAATNRSTRNVEAILYSATMVSKGMNDASREYLDFVRGQFAKNMDRMNELWRCRTPQELVAVQSDFMREAVKELFERQRRIADISIRLADQAGSHITKSIEEEKRAA
jgi:hypothetical protein